MEGNDKSAEGAAKKGKDGLFTGRLAWWQVLLAVALVAYLVYGKYQQTVVDAQGAPTTPAKSK